MNEAQNAQTEAHAGQAAATNLLDEIVEASRLRPDDEGFSATKNGLRAFLKELVKDGPETKVSTAVVDRMMTELDEKLSAQTNAIMHCKEFQSLESAWRGMKFLIDRTDFRQNIKIEFINASKEDLLDDFEDAPEITRSGLYKNVYTSEYGQFGGQPVGVILGNYEFTPGTQDMALLQNIASVSAMSHAPFISAASKSFFGIDSWEKLPNLKDIKSILEMPQYTKWRSFRESENARYVGLTLPRFLLRVPFGPDTVPAKTFTFQEEAATSDDFCWGNTAFAFGSRLTESFAKYRWCANIIGPQGGGAVENLPVYNFESMGQIQTRIPTEILISERREYELSEEGFIALTMRKGADNAAFFSANSCQKAKVFANTPEGKEAELNYRLSTQLPYMMIMNRLAHYIKVIQRENIGTWKERTDLERELNKWISQYVTEMDDPDPVTRSKRPLRMAKINVSDVAGEPGWYSVNILARPHFKYMGASFTLSLVGKLDKE